VCASIGSIGSGRSRQVCMGFVCFGHIYIDLQGLMRASVIYAGLCRPENICRIIQASKICRPVARYEAGF
jgi:hypothetical protein